MNKPKATSKWKRCRGSKMRSNKLDKSTTREKEVPRLSHKSDKHQPLPKGPKYECYTPLMANHTIILEEAFNTKVPIKLPCPFFSGQG